MTIKFGIIGCTGIGQAHGNMSKELEEIEWVAAADVVKERADETRKNYGLEKAYYNAEDLINDPEIDALLIAAPTKFHHSLCLAALKAGKHVLIEKPPATSVEQVKDMIRARDEAGKVVACCYQRRHESTHQKAFKMLREGAIGKIYHAKAWWLNNQFNMSQGKPCFQWSTRGAAMGSLGGHYMDLAWWLCDRPQVLKVMALAHTGHSELVVDEDAGDDTMTVLMEAEGGLSILVEATRRRHDTKTVGAMIYGMEGAYDGERGVIIRQAQDGEMIEEEVGPVRKVDHHLREQLRAFAKAIKGEGPTIIPLEESLRYQQIMDAIYESAEKREPVILNMD